MDVSVIGAIVALVMIATGGVVAVMVGIAHMMGKSESFVGGLVFLAAALLLIGWCGAVGS